MNRKAAFILILILSLSSILLYTLIVPATFTSSTATISVDPAKVIASVGTNFTIHINISDVVDLYGWEFKLGWNSTLLEGLNVTEGSFLQAGGETFFASKINNTAGYMLVDCTLLGDVSGVSGNGILATAQFHVEDQGECVLDLYKTTLVSSAEQPITHTAADGHFLAILHDIAIRSVTVSQATAYIGQVVDIMVDVGNEGTETESFEVTVYANTTAIETQTVTGLEGGKEVSLTFVWNTTEAKPGNYTMSAQASVVPDEKDTADNSFTDGTVLLTIPIHDIAITNVTPSETSVTSGEIVYIYVTVQNQGDFDETFTVNASYMLRVDPVIGTQTVTLSSGTETKLTFTWNTTDISGYCSLSAAASVVSGETDTADNTYTNGTVRIHSGSGASNYSSQGLQLHRGNPMILVASAD